MLEKLLRRLKKRREMNRARLERRQGHLARRKMKEFLSGRAMHNALADLGLPG
jgi:hypothetical protein